MVLSSLGIIGTIAPYAICTFVFIVFILGYLDAKDKSNPEEDFPVDDEEQVVYKQNPVNHEPQALRVKDGHYEVNGVNGKKAKIHKFTPDGSRIYWVLTMPNESTYKHWTKKAAVAQAIEGVK